MSKFAGKNFHTDNPPTLAMLHAKQGILNITSFFGKNTAKQSFFRSKFSLALGGNFTNQDIIFSDFGADADNSIFIQVLKFKFANIWYIPSSDFRSEFSIPNYADKLLKIYGSELAFFYQTLGNNYRVFVICSGPGQKSHKNILSQ